MDQQQRGFQASLEEAPIFCANNCEFFGTATTMNLCSKCHKDLILKEHGDKLASSPIGNILGGNHEPTSIAICPQTTSVESTSITAEANSTSPLNTDRDKELKKSPNKCTTFNKRVGMTGFTCRRGGLFSAVHRYSDKHDCPYNYHCAARDAIAKANPVVKASKLDKI